MSSDTRCTPFFRRESTSRSAVRTYIRISSSCLRRSWRIGRPRKSSSTCGPIPADLIAKIVAAENYQAAYFNVRQLLYGLNDMAWHSIDKPFEGDVELFERTAMAPAQVLPVVEGAAMSPAFSHIFAGGYAAGYYGYKWAEVLAADAFSLFKEKGIFNPEVAEAFRREILSKGGHEHPMTLYVNFRGHKPETKALIEKMGLEK